MQRSVFMPLSNILASHRIKVVREVLWNFHRAKTWCVISLKLRRQFCYDSCQKILPHFALKNLGFGLKGLSAKIRAWKLPKFERSAKIIWPPQKLYSSLSSPTTFCEEENHSWSAKSCDRKITSLKTFKSFHHPQLQIAKQQIAKAALTTVLTSSIPFAC